MTAFRRPDPRLLLPVAIAAAVAASGVSGARLQEPARGVAMAAAIDGTVHVTFSGSDGSRPLELFERLPVGARLDTSPGAAVLLVYRVGSRVRLLARSSGIVSERGLTVRTGRVERLPEVPPLPAFDPPADVASLRRVAAVRVRGGEFRGLYPAAGARSLPDSTVLTFVAPDGYGGFAIEVEDPVGRVVFTQRTSSASLAVPSGVLEPGREYLWRVSARTPAGTTVRGEASFATLSAAEAGWRVAARRTLPEREPRAEWLAEIDLALGLLREAREGFQAAGSARTGTAVIASRLQAIEQALGVEP